MLTIAISLGENIARARVQFKKAKFCTGGLRHREDLRYVDGVQLYFECVDGNIDYQPQSGK